MPPIIDPLQKRGCTAYALRSHKGILQYGGRDDYHKVILLSGTGEIRYGCHVYKINGSVLLITQPGINCTWHLSHSNCEAYVCAFTEDFIQANFKRPITNSDDHFLLHPVFKVNSEQEEFLRSLFCRMVDEQQTTYVFKEELIQNQLCVLTHMARRMAVSNKVMHSGLSTKPMGAVYLELVELGFPLVGQALHFN